MCLDVTFKDHEVYIEINDAMFVCKSLAQLFSESSLPVPSTCYKEQTKALVLAFHAGQLM